MTNPELPLHYWSLNIRYCLLFCFFFLILNIQVALWTNAFGIHNSFCKLQSKVSTAVSWLLRPCCLRLHKHTPLGSEADDSAKIKKHFQTNWDAYKSKTSESASKHYFTKFVTHAGVKIYVNVWVVCFSTSPWQKTILPACSKTAPSPTKNSYPALVEGVYDYTTQKKNSPKKTEDIWFVVSGFFTSISHSMDVSMWAMCPDPGK